MPSIRYRAHGFVCAVNLYDVPNHDTAYIKNKPSSNGEDMWSPVRWLGFICSRGSKVLTWARPAKINACAVSNGDGFAGSWRDLKSDEYAVGFVLEISDSTYGVFGLVDSDCWPVIRSDTSPRLSVVSPTGSNVSVFKRNTG